jgi:hypothetical protein
MLVYDFFMMTLQVSNVARSGKVKIDNNRC